MNIYPAIDIRKGRCVRLKQGRADCETIYFNDPVEPARLWREAGAEWIHVVDLDGALSGEPQNWQLVEKICALGVKVQMGGGLRESVSIKKAFNIGVSRVVIGTRACEDEVFIKTLVDRYSNKIAVGIDAKNGRGATQGWINTTKLKALDFATKISTLGVETIIYTDISRDGMLYGPNFNEQKRMLSKVDVKIIASGGISTYEDIDQFFKISEKHPGMEGVIIGKALYEDKINLAKVLKH